MRLTVRAPWWAGVFVLALGMRLAYVLGADEPLLYSHPYNYFHGGLSIVEHPRPWSFVLRSDAWHQWLGPWTIAPLYYLFVAGSLAVFGPHLLPLQLLHCGLDSAVAVMVGALGRELWRRHGAWAGVAYALNAHAIELCGQTLTENVHTPLLVSAFCVLLLEARRPDLRLTALGGFLLGLSGLARSVSTAFVPLAALWRMRAAGGRALDLRAGGVLVAAAAIAIVPWTARNVFFIGDWVPVESISVYNLWDDNCFVEGERRQRQEHTIAAQPTLAAQRAQALKYAWRGITRNPGRFAEKAWLNLLHFVRLDGLHLLLRVEEAQPAWRHAALVLLDDSMVAATVALLIVFLLAGHPSRARSLLILWTSYYLLMVVVVFHNEIRYRSTLMPLALAGAMGGLAVLADAERRRLPRARLALALGAVSVAFMLVPYPARAWRAMDSSRTMRQARAAVERGDLAQAEALAWRAANQDREAARPWLLYGRALARAQRAPEAIEAYGRARARKSHHWTPGLVLPQLLREAGRLEEAAAAAQEANRFSFHVDKWLALEVTWHELPAPRADEVLLARGDYGAARGFSLPHRDHRWSLARSCVRLRPTVPAAAYDVLLDMGSPPPSPYEAPSVSVSIEDGTSAEFRLGRQVATYSLRTPAPAGETLVICLRAPTWNRTGQPAEQGVRVDRVRVVPES